MKAIQYAEYGGPEVLRLVDVDEPHAGPGQVRIAVHAAGVNGIDWKIRSGLLAGGKPLKAPSGTGFDASGVVDEVGAGVNDVAVGDAVFGMGQATYAERALLSSWAKKPETLPFDQAAGYPIPAETAARVLNDLGVREGQTLLVSGASGGVGSATVQFARYRGLTVIGTASARNQEYLQGLGALATTYGPGLVDRVRALALKGVDAAVDIAGSGVIPELIELTGEPSTVLSIADFTAPAHGARVSTNPVNAIAALSAAARMHAEGKFRLRVDQTFSLDHAAKAQAAAESGHAAGRIVIVVR